MTTAWKFLNTADHEAVRQQQSMLAAIDRWWRSFEAKIPDLEDFFSRKKEWDLPAWMHDQLAPIDERLNWEFSRDHVTHHMRLVITPEAEKQLRPLVHTIIERAPRRAGWTFHAWRQPETPADAIESVRARTGGDIMRTTVSVRKGKGNAIDLVYFSPDCTSADDQDALGPAFVATECILGEETLDKWIGLIQVARPRWLKRSLPLGRLKETVEALIESTCDQLPDRPCHERIAAASWSVFALEPDPCDDYPFRQDLGVATTMHPELWMAAHAQGFYSCRFSKLGETFCFIKIEQGENFDGADPDQREKLQETLDKALAAGNLGGVMGRGTGLRYSYYDLALVDLDKATPVLRRTLQAANMPRRTWLMFFDANWQGEWIGIWDDPPPPPSGP